MPIAYRRTINSDNFTTFGIFRAAIQEFQRGDQTMSVFITVENGVTYVQITLSR